MSLMWTGPSAALIASYSDPLACRLARRAGEQSIFFDVSHNGRSAKVYRMEKSRGAWHRVDLGDVTAGDVLGVHAKVSLEFTEHDSELFALLGRLTMRRHEELMRYAQDQIGKITGIADVIADALVMGRRCVRA